MIWSRWVSDWMTISINVITGKVMVYLVLMLWDTVLYPSRLPALPRRFYTHHLNRSTVSHELLPPSLRRRWGSAEVRDMPEAPESEPDFKCGVSALRSVVLTTVRSPLKLLVFFFYFLETSLCSCFRETPSSSPLISSVNNRLGTRRLLRTHQGYHRAR